MSYAEQYIQLRQTDTPGYLDVSDAIELLERADAKIAALRERCERLEASLEECAADLAERVDAEYPDRDIYPDDMRRYLRDMQPVQTARALLDALAAQEKEA